MRYVQFTLIVLIVAVGTTWLHPTQRVLARAPQHASRQDFPPVPGGTPIVIGLPNLNPPTATAVPASSQPHKRAAPPDAVRIALNNALVKALLKGRAYRVQRVVPWHAGKGSLVVVNFYHSMTLTGTWLAVGKAAYRATYQRVTGLQIYVKALKRVVGIAPGFVPKRSSIE